VVGATSSEGFLVIWISVKHLRDPSASSADFGRLLGTFLVVYHCVHSIKSLDDEALSKLISYNVFHRARQLYKNISMLFLFPVTRFCCLMLD